jgi:mono/diheme cytochrome c family protein
MRNAALKWLMVANVMIGLNGSGAAQDAGRTEYLWSCAACHSVDGKGNGPLGAELRTAPADLTTLAKRNNGVFPLGTVYETIDGRKAVKSHGTRDMPIWGYRYTPPPHSPTSSAPTEPYVGLSYDPENVVRVRILALVDYLSRIQEK